MMSQFSEVIVSWVGGDYLKMNDVQGIFYVMIPIYLCQNCDPQFTDIGT